jgi:hypothetical protein
MRTVHVVLQRLVFGLPERPEDDTPVDDPDAEELTDRMAAELAEQGVWRDDRLLPVLGPPIAGVLLQVPMAERTLVWLSSRATAQQRLIVICRMRQELFDGTVGWQRDPDLTADQGIPVFTRAFGIPGMS